MNFSHENGEKNRRRREIMMNEVVNATHSGGNFN